MRQPIDRRRFMAWFSATGLMALMAPSALGQDDETIAIEAISRSETISGLTFTTEERELMRNSVKEHLDSFRKLRELPVPNALAPALTFSPLLPGRSMDSGTRPVVFSNVDSTKIDIGDPALAEVRHIRLAREEIQNASITTVSGAIGHAKHGLGSQAHLRGLFFHQMRVIVLIRLPQVFVALESKRTAIQHDRLHPLVERYLAVIRVEFLINRT